MSGQALHDMIHYQVTVPLTWSAVVQSLTFESLASESPLKATAAIVNKRCRLQRGFSISVVGYSTDSSISTVGYSANFESPVAYIANLYGKIISYIGTIGYIGE